MSFEQHPTDPDKLVMRAGNYNLQKPWVRLTLKEIQELAEESHGGFHPIDLTLALAVEAKLKEKNT